MHEWGEPIRWVRPTCPAGRERVRYTERLARSMGSDDDMFRIWSGPEGSSHKEPLSGIRIHRAHGLYFCAVLPNRAMLDAARHPRRHLSFKRQGMTRRSMPCLFHANLFALGGARWRCQNIGGPAIRALWGNVSLVLGCACGIARLPNTSPPTGPRRPKITRRWRINLNNSFPRVVLLAGVAKTLASSLAGCLLVF